MFETFFSLFGTLNIFWKGIAIVLVVLFLYLFKSKLYPKFKKYFEIAKRTVLPEKVIHLKALETYDKKNRSAIEHHFSEHKETPVYSLHGLIYSLLDGSTSPEESIKVIGKNNEVVYRNIPLGSMFVDLDTAKQISFGKLCFYYGKVKIESAKYPGTFLCLFNLVVDDQGKKFPFDRKKKMQPSFFIKKSKLKDHKMASFLLRTLPKENIKSVNANFIALGRIIKDEKTGSINFDFQSDRIDCFCRVLESQEKLDDLTNLLKTK